MTKSRAKPSKTREIGAKTGVCAESRRFHPLQPTGRGWFLPPKAVSAGGGARKAVIRFF
jgi:hypothetical protein